METSLKKRNTNGDKPRQMIGNKSVKKDCLPNRTDRHLYS